VNVIHRNHHGIGKIVDITGHELAVESFFSGHDFTAKYL